MAITSPLPSALGAAALNPGLSEQLFAHEISRSPELRHAAADRVGVCERALTVWPLSLRALAVSPPPFSLLLQIRTPPQVSRRGRKKGGTSPDSSLTGK